MEFLLRHIGNHTLHDLADAGGKFMRRTILRLGEQRFAQAFHQSFLVGDGGFQFRNLVFHTFQTILVGCNALREKANSFKVGRSINRRQSLANLFANLIVFLRSLFLLRDGFNQLRRVYFSKMLCSYNIADNLAFLFLRQIVDRGKAFQRKRGQSFLRNSVGNCLRQCRNLRCVAIGLLFQDILNGLCIQQIADGVILTNGPFVFELLIGDSS